MAKNAKKKKRNRKPLGEVAVTVCGSRGPLAPQEVAIRLDDDQLSTILLWADEAEIDPKDIDTLRDQLQSIAARGIELLRGT